MFEIFGSIVLALTMTIVNVPPDPTFGGVDTDDPTLCAAPISYDESGDVVSDPCESQVRTAPVRPPSPRQ